MDWLICIIFTNLSKLAHYFYEFGQNCQFQKMINQLKDDQYVCA